MSEARRPLGERLGDALGPPAGLLLAAMKRRGTVTGALLGLLFRLWVNVTVLPPWFVGLHARRLGGAVAAGVRYWRAERAYCLERKSAWEKWMQQRRVQRI